MSTHPESLGLNSAQNVRRYWLRQANLAMNQLIANKLLGSSEFTADKAPVILDEFANTASAGSVIAFHRQPSCSACPDGIILAAPIKKACLWR